MFDTCWSASGRCGSKLQLCLPFPLIYQIYKYSKTGFISFFCIHTLRSYTPSLNILILGRYGQCGWWKYIDLIPGCLQKGYPWYGTSLHLKITVLPTHKYETCFSNHIQNGWGTPIIVLTIVNQSTVLNSNPGNIFLC